jgi:hypothetical protein
VVFHGLLCGQLYFLYAHDIRTSQEARLLASMACHRGRFTFLCVDNIPITLESRLWIPQACYGDSDLFYLLISSKFNCLFQIKVT